MIDICILESALLCALEMALEINDYPSARRFNHALDIVAQQTDTEINRSRINVDELIIATRGGHHDQY